MESMSPDIYSQHRRLSENRDVISKWKAIVNFPEIPVNHSVQTSSYPSWARVMEAEGGVAVVVVVSRLRCHAVTLLNVRGCSNFRWKCLLVRLLLCPRRVSAHNWVLVPDVTTSHEPCLPPPPDHWRAETNTATGQSSASQTYQQREKWSRVPAENKWWYQLPFHWQLNPGNCTLCVSFFILGHKAILRDNWLYVI